jgi:hypothetical protein
MDFLIKNSLYVVLCVALTVWAGIAWYLFRLERMVVRLEAQTQANAQTDSQASQTSAQESK